MIMTWYAMLCCGVACYGTVCYDWYGVVVVGWVWVPYSGAQVFLIVRISDWAH